MNFKKIATIKVGTLNILSELSGLDISGFEISVGLKWKGIIQIKRKQKNSNHYYLYEIENIEKFMLAKIKYEL